MVGDTACRIVCKTNAKRCAETGSPESSQLSVEHWFLGEVTSNASAHECLSFGFRCFKGLSSRRQAGSPPGVPPITQKTDVGLSDDLLPQPVIYFHKHIATRRARFGRLALTRFPTDRPRGCMCHFLRPPSIFPSLCLAGVRSGSASLAVHA